MFGLPTGTALMVFGFPLFWIIYTAIFLYRSRDWDVETHVEDDVK